LLGAYYFDESINNKQALTLGRDFRNYADFLTRDPRTPTVPGAYVALESTIRALAGVPSTAAQFGGQGQGRFEDWDYKNKAYSIFGTADLELTDGLVLTGGFNYTKDKKNLASNTTITDVFSAIDLVQVGANAGLPAALPAGYTPLGGTALSAGLFPRINSCATVTNAPAASTPNPTRSGTCNPFLGLQALQFLPPFLNLPNAVEDGRTSDGKLTYSVRLAWEATDNINLYASYGTGFKATSWNMSIDSRPFASDFVAGSPAQGKPITPSAIRTAGLASANLTSGTRYALPEEAKVMELGLKAKWDSVAFNLTIFDQSIKNFQGNSFIGTGFVLSNAGKQSVKGIEFDGSVNPIDALQLRAAFVYLDSKYDSYVGSQFGDVSGQAVAGIPKLSTTLGATYTADLNDGKSLILNVDYHNESNVVINENPAWRQYKREVNDLSAAATLRLDSGLQFSLWGRNLTNAKYLAVIFPSVVQSGSISGYPNQPRTYGASVKYKF
jgi:outer membrane receptor protein involved in Fe transport